MINTPPLHYSTSPFPNKGNIIGGMFGWAGMHEHSSDCVPDFLRGDPVMLLSARCGIRLLINQLRPKRVWMPSYLCEDMLQAVDIDQSELAFYPIDGNLQVRNRRWVSQAGKGALVLAIDYFGFPFDRCLIAELRDRGCVVLEDACQALLTEGVGDVADYALFSPRKFTGVPDGGVINSRHEKLDWGVQLDAAPGVWWLNAFDAFVRRGEFDRHGGVRDWFAMYQAIEKSYPPGPYRMSELAANILKYGTNYARMAARRRSNYRILAARLTKWAMFPDLPDEVVPLGFPVRLKERDLVRGLLFEARIFSPVHWTLTARVPASFVESHELSARIMTLPCDQRYAKADMDFLADRFEAACTAANASPVERKRGEE